MKSPDIINEIYPCFSTEKEDCLRRARLIPWLVAVFFVVLIVCLWANRAGASEYTDEQIVNAIYLAEGAAKAQYAYGIRSIPYRDIKEARRICFNTVRNNRKRFANQTKYKDYLEFLASRYCPVSVHPKNKFWLRNVNYFLTKSTAK
jgi:hypothetical protein